MKGCFFPYETPADPQCLHLATARWSSRTCDVDFRVAWKSHDIRIPSWIVLRGILSPEDLLDGICLFGSREFLLNEGVRTWRVETAACGK